MSSSTVARPNGARRILRATTAGVLALAVALSGPVASAQDTEPTTTETVTTTPVETPSPTEPPAETPTGTPTGTPAETPTETPTGTPTQTLGETTEEAPTESTEPTGETRPGEPERPDAEERNRRLAETEAPPRTPRADLRVSIAFGRAEYAPESDIDFTVTVSNVGTAPAKDVRFQRHGDLWLKEGGWQLGRLPGPTLAPGETAAYHLVGRQNDARRDTVQYQVQVSMGVQDDESIDPTPNDNYAQASARVPQGRGKVSGVVYRDANGNGRFDGGEGVPNIGISANGGLPRSYAGGVTDASGRFPVRDDVSTGLYRLSLYNNPPGGAVIAPGFSEFTLAAGEDKNLEIPLVAPISDVLKPTVELDRDTYNRGDRVEVTVTLKNSGTTALTGIVAVCDQYQDKALLDGTGPEWAPLSPAGPGVALAAGETKVLTIGDVVPDGAYETGQVGVACLFGIDRVNTAGAAGSSDFAEVVGAFGGIEGTVLFDSGDGEEKPLVGGHLITLDQRSGLPSWHDNGYTSGEGRFALTKVVPGRTKVLLLGAYKDKATGAAEYVVDVVAGQAARLDLVVVTGPEVVKPRHDPKIEVTASFEKAAYDIAEPMTAKVTIRNTGVGQGAPLEFQSDHTPSVLEYDTSQWGALLPRYNSPTPPAHPELWPGETLEVTLVGTYPRWDFDGKVRLKGRIVNTYGGASTSFDIAADVTHQKGDATILLYGDANGNGAYDQGEELPGTRVSAEGGLPRAYYHGDTDSSGRFRIEDGVAGHYNVSVYGNDQGWITPRDFFRQFAVLPGGDVVAEFGLIRPLSDKLRASIALDRDSYQPGDPVGVEIEVTNNTGSELTVKAMCGGESMPALDNESEWGPLAWNGPGVVIADGATYVQHVVDELPWGAADHGLFAVNCDLGPEGGDGNPFVGDFAKVPGAVSTTTARVLTGDYPYEGVPGVKVVLLERFTDEYAAAGTTDDEGAVVFPDLPVGHYTPVVVGPWKVLLNRQLPIVRSVRGSTGEPQEIHVEPGPEVADPSPVPGAPNPGAPNPGGAAQPPAGGGPIGGPDNPLAATGASVLGLGLVGLLLLAIGLGARRLGRRTA